MKRKMFTGILTMLFVLLFGMGTVMADDIIIADTDEKAEEMGVNWYFVQPESGSRYIYWDVKDNTIDITLVKGETPRYMEIGFGEYEHHMDFNTLAVSGSSAIIYDGAYERLFPSTKVIPGDFEQAVLQLVYNNQTAFDAGQYTVTVPAGFFQIRETDAPKKLYTNQEVTINITILEEAPSIASPSVTIVNNRLTWDAIEGAACYDIIYYEDEKTIPNGSVNATTSDLANGKVDYILDVTRNFPYLSGHKYTVVVTAYPLENSKAGGKASNTVEIPFTETDFPEGIHWEWIKSENATSIDGKTVLKVTADQNVDLKDFYFIMRLYANDKCIMNWRAMSFSDGGTLDATSRLEKANAKAPYYMLVYAIDKTNTTKAACSKPLQVTEEASTVEDILTDIKDGTLSAEQVDAIAEELLQKSDNINDLNALLSDTSANKTDVRQGYTNLDQAARKAKNISVTESVATDRLKTIFDESKLASAGLALNAASGTASQPTNISLKVDEPKSTLPIPSGYNVSSSVQVDISVEPQLENQKYPVMITMPIPSTLNPDRRIVIFHGNETIYPIVNKTAGTITFSVTHFSTFAFANVATSTTTNTRPTRPSGSGSSGSSGSSSGTHASTTASALSTNVKPGNWAKSSSGWQFSFTDRTYAKSQWLQVKDKWYFFDADGYMSTGWQMIDGKWYYLDPANGDMAEGWKIINGKWYFLNSANGDMAMGWKMVDSKWYYLDPVNGDMAEGWKIVNGKWYYLNPVSGDMATGKTLINNSWYYLTADGDCLMNAETPDGHRADANGVVLYGSAQ